MALLEVRDLEVYYGVIQALKGISFDVNEGEIVTLIGANGAGKTTTMQSIMGLIPVKHGSVTYEGQIINKVPSHKIVKLGMTQVPEGRHVFQELTVYENLLLGGYIENDKKKIKADIEDVYERFPRLKERSSQIAGTLSGGEQQMLAMGRAIMSHPKLLMLDEPSMGLAPILVDQIFDMAGSSPHFLQCSRRKVLFVLRHIASLCVHFSNTISSPASTISLPGPSNRSALSISNNLPGAM